MNNTDNNSEKTKDSKKKHFTLNGKVHFIIEIILVFILVLCIDNYIYLNNKASDLEAKMEEEPRFEYKAIENFFKTPEEVFIKYGYGSDERKASITEYLYTMPNDEHNKEVLCPDDNVYYYSEYNSQSIIDKGNEILNDELRKEMMQREVIRYSDQIGELKKPVIYLYGYNNEEVNISLVLNDATLSCSYPEYNNGWKIKAQPDGHLIDEYGNTYKYLYWEAESNKQWDMSDGFCIKGENTAEFLEKSLKTLGLNSDEINEFISYWLPQMKNNKFNVIKFQDKEYLETAKINIDNKPDNMIRVFMTWYPSDEFVEIEQQELNGNSIDRRGKTLVEWGGSKIEN